MTVRTTTTENPIVATDTVIDSVSATASSTVTTTEYTATASIVVKRSIIEQEAKGNSCPAPSPPENPVPTYASACPNGAAFSSACSCVGITAGRTKELRACTSTVHVKVTQTTTMVGSETEGATETLAQTSTVTTITPTATMNAATTHYAFSPICSTVTASADAAGTATTLTYTMYYGGAGKAENPNNPGNQLPAYFPPLTATFAQSLTPCEAAQQCADDAVGASGTYFQFDLDFLQSSGSWRCVQYLDSNSNGAGEYSIPDNDVVQAYGFNGAT